jgi:uncharacterized membrane protein YhaH (DUF805 family)
MEWMIMPYRRYADFSGRSRRMEYWMFALFNIIVLLAAGGLMLAGGLTLADLDESNVAEPNLGPLFWVGAVAGVIFFLGSFIPGIAVTVRRFHDRDMSGWWVLGFAVLSNLPYVGLLASIVELVITALPGTRGANRYGEDPMNPEFNAEVFS